jgi:1-acylglycerone phosphate reductase
MLGRLPETCEFLRSRAHELSDHTAHSATPWNGIYSSSKGALHLMTDALSMECSFLSENIKVILVTPGAVKSNIAKNAADYDVPPDSLFKQFTQSIHKRIMASQGPNALTGKEFSQHIVSQVLSPKPPGYITYGGHATAFAIAHWMPRFCVRWVMWKIFNKPNQL